MTVWGSRTSTVRAAAGALWAATWLLVPFVPGALWAPLAVFAIVGQLAALGCLPLTLVGLVRPSLRPLALDGLAFAAGYWLVYLPLHPLVVAWLPDGS